MCVRHKSEIKKIKTSMKLEDSLKSRNTINELRRKIKTRGSLTLKSQIKMIKDLDMGPE